MSKINAFKKEIVRIAKCNIDGHAWDYGPSRQAKRNDKVKFGIFEYKCNLFVYEVLLASLIDIGTPNETSHKRWILHLQGKNERPPTARQWYDGEVPYFEEIDKSDVEGGDICSDGKHVGIVSEYGSTISANGDKIVENNFGFRKGQNNVKFFALCETP